MMKVITYCEDSSIGIQCEYESTVNCKKCEKPICQDDVYKYQFKDSINNLNENYCFQCILNVK